MNTSRYHKFLRISLLVVAALLVFDGGFVSSVTKTLSDSTIEYLANAGSGVFARVEPNELNVITAELTAKEQELKEREAALSEREIASRDFGSSASTQSDYSTYILSIILFVLTVLIVLNYAMDWARVRKDIYESKTT